MNWIKVLYPEKRTIFVNGRELGNTNALKFLGEDGEYRFDLGEPRDYEPTSQQLSVVGTSRARPIILRFQPKP